MRFLYNGLAVYYHFQSYVTYITHMTGFSLGLPLGIAWSPQWKRNLMKSIGLLIAYSIVFCLVVAYVLPNLA